MKKLYSIKKLNVFSLIAFMVMMVGLQMGAFAQSGSDCISEAQPVRTYLFFVTTDSGTTYDTVSVKIIKNGEAVPRPEFVGIEYSTFRSWYTVSDPELFSDDTYKYDESNFTTPQIVTESDTVRLYASLTHDVFHVIFMDGVGDDARVFRVWERLAGTTDLDPDNEQVIVDATTKSVGWYYDQALSQQATTFTMPSYDVVLYPDIQTGHWVKYQSVGGTYVEPDFYQYDETTNKPDDPQKVGYSFSGWNNGTEPWYRADGTVNQFGGLLTDELTLTAVWTPNEVTYTVVYWVENADDENYSFNNVRTGTANSGTQITTLAEQYTTVNTTNIVDGMSPYVTTFSYDKTTQADATDVTVAGDGSTVINLYYKRKTFTLTFDPSKYYSGSSSASNNSSTVSQSSEVITAKYGANIWSRFPITRNLRYRTSIFSSWTTIDISMWKATNTNVYSYALQTISTMPGSNVTFYLYTNSNTTQHTIYYALQNIEGTGFDTTTVTTYFNFVTYTEEYCDIQGFSKQSESDAGFGTITMNSSTFDHAKKFGDDGTVTLEYYRNSYDIRFYNGGEELTDSAQTRKYQQVIGTLPVLADSLAPVGKDGFSFGGWYENQLCEGDPIDITSTMPAAHVILYAKWNAPDYTVRIHHTVAAVGDYDDVVVAYGEQVPSASLESVHPCSDNAPAYGWSILNDDGTKSTFASDMQVYRDLALVPFCLLTGERYTITYNMNCEGAAAVVDASVYADGSNPMVMSPSQDTCGNSKNKFLGWQEADEVFHYPGNGIYMTENKTLTALWGSGTEHTEVVMVEHHPTTGDQTSSLDIVTNGTTPLNLPENFERPDRPNDLFIGWSLSENNTMPEFAPGESVVLSCDVSIYPVWMQIISNMPSQSVCEGLDVDIKSLVTYHIQNDAYTYGTIENIQDTVWIVTKDGAEFTDYTDLVISSAEAGEYVVNMVLVTTKGVTDTLVNIINVVSGQFDPVFTDLLLTYCEGEHDALPTTSSAVEATATSPAIPAVTGIWQSMSTGTIETVTAVPSEAGVYNLTFVPDPGQCANSVNLSFTVVEAPDVNINGNNAFCVGGSTELQAAVDATVSVEEYQWLQEEAGTWTEISGATSQTYNATAAGNYKVEITTTEGCVVTSEIEVTVNPSLAGDDYATICETQLPYEWQGVTFDAEGTQTITLQSLVTDCDSVVTLHLTVNPSLAGDDYATVCETQLPYEWQGVTFEAEGTQTITLQSLVTDCDSVVTLHLTVNESLAGDDYATVCETQLPYEWQGVTFDAEGTQTITLQSLVTDCDSVVTLHLTVNPLPTLSITNKNQTLVYGESVETAVITNEHSTISYMLPAEFTATATNQISTIGNLSVGTYEIPVEALSDQTPGCGILYDTIKVTINPRTVILTSASDTREYNGDVLTNNTVTVSGDGFATGEGATYNVTGQQLLPGSSYNTFTYSLNAGTLEGNYEITTEFGTLTVTDRTTPYEVTMTSNSNDAPIIYDGMEHSINDFVTHTFIVDGNTYTVSGLTASSEPQIFAGTYENTISGDPVVKDEYDNDVTDQFTVNMVVGTLTISKRLISISIENPEDATKVYDGTPLTITFDKLHVDNLASTDELIGGTLTSSSSEVGEYIIEEGNMFYMMATGTFTKSGFKIKHSLYPAALAKTLASYSASISISGSITAIECDGVTYQGYDYPAVLIGTQCWLAENLRNTATATGPINSYAAYNDDVANVDAFGYLYTWYSAVGVPEGDNTTMPETTTTTSGETYVQGICPEGWAVPSQADFEILQAFTSGEVRRLRDMSTMYWIPGTEGVTPNYNFNSRAGGFYNSVSGQFERMLLEDYYWMSNSEPGSTEVTTAASAYYCSDIPFLTSKKSDKRSVRCIHKE